MMGRVKYQIIFLSGGIYFYHHQDEGEDDDTEVDDDASMRMEVMVISQFRPNFTISYRTC